MARNLVLLSKSFLGSAHLSAKQIYDIGPIDALLITYFPSSAKQIYDIGPIDALLITYFPSSAKQIYDIGPIDALLILTFPLLLSRSMTLGL